MRDQLEEELIIVIMVVVVVIEVQQGIEDHLLIQNDRQLQTRISRKVVVHQVEEQRNDYQVS